MANVLRNGIVVPFGSFRQSLKDFSTSLDFRSGGIAKITSTENPFVGNYYVSAWVKWFGNNGAYQHIFSKRDSYGATTMNLDLALDPSTDHVALDTGNGYVDFSAVLPLERWTHICYVHDGTPVLKERLYMDSLRVASASITGQGTGSSALMSIGAAEATAVEPFNGLIDEVVVGTYSPDWHDVIRMNKKFVHESAWGYWKLDEGSGSAILDSSGNDRHGVITTAAFSSDVALKSRN